MSSYELAGKSALITGAAGGMGSAIAAAFRREGARVALLDQDAERLEVLTTSLGGPSGEAIGLRADLRDEAETRTAVATALDAFGGMDVLVNNAGILHHVDLAELAAPDWNRVFAVNVRAALLLAQLVSPSMRSRGGGSIVNVASITGHMASPRGAAYSASKAALISLTEQIAVEWGPYQIRCNAVSPGITNVAMRGSVADPARKRQQVEAMVPLGRGAEATDISEAVVFLASARAAYISGVTLLVDGALAPSLLFHSPGAGGQGTAAPFSIATESGACR